MATKNDGKVRSFRHGGTIAIGSDSFINIPAGGGGMEFDFAMRERLLDASMDQGELGSVPEGDNKRGHVSFSVRYTGDAATAGSFIAVLTAASADGLVVTNDIVVTIFDKPGGTAGESFTFSNAFVDDAGISFTTGGGTETDTFKATFLHDARQPAVAAVP